MSLNATLLIQMTVFAVVVLFSMKFIWPMIMEAIEERNKNISDGLAAAEQGQKKLSEAETEVNTLIKEAKEGEPEEYSYAPGKRFHYGLIAQEVEQVLDEQGVDKNLFGAWHLANKEDPLSSQSLKYHEFISPLIKAVQELSEKVSVLEKKVTDLGG